MAKRTSKERQTEISMTGKAQMVPSSDATRPSSPRRRPLGRAVLLCLSALLLATGGIAADAEDPARVYSGRAETYQNLAPESLERLSTPDAIKAATMPNVAPTRIWRTLEHAERVECLDCIPYVSKLLYQGDARTREIGAWWLRRRVFGVFGPGEVYSQVVDTLGDPEQSEARRAYAAEALGEFLTHAGLAPVARAAIEDPSARVRLSAVNALRRLGHQGPDGELGQAIGDSDEKVRLAALSASVRINTFSHVDAVVERIGDESAIVRRRAAQVLGTLRSSDAVVGLIALTSPDSESDARVRASAVFALGQIGEPSAKEAVQAAQDDPDGFVRDAARIALRRL